MEEFVRVARAFVHVRRRKERRDWNKHWSAELYVKWRLLGAGHYGEAWEHADHPGAVLKISGPAGFGRGRASAIAAVDGVQYDAWPEYIKVCAAHPHKHLPRVFWYEHASAGIFWAVLPKYRFLQKNYSSGFPQAIGYIKMRLLGRERGRRGYEWLEPLMELARRANWRLDLHNENVMYDPLLSTYVLTDPFSTNGETVPELVQRERGDHYATW